jgi:pilus assembly protein Flp/PilA
MYAMYLYLKNLLEREEGQDLAEYALLLLLIAIVVIGAVTLLGGQITTVFTNITGSLGGS